MYIGIHVMCKDYNHLLFRDEFLRVSSLEGLHCQLWCTYQRSQQSLCSLELVVQEFLLVLAELLVHSTPLYVKLTQQGWCRSVPHWSL